MAGSAATEDGEFSEAEILPFRFFFRLLPSEAKNAS
jgi:hypothetical protein